MNTKTDIDRLLMDSFKKLVLKVPVEKITIKEITDEAGVIRPTFYNHFQDKYEVIERIVKEEILMPVKPLLDNGMVREAIFLIFTNVLKEKDFYCHLSGMEGQNSFASIVKNSVQQLILEFITEKVGNKRFKNAWLTPLCGIGMDCFGNADIPCRSIRNISLCYDPIHGGYFTGTGRGINHPILS